MNAYPLTPALWLNSAAAGVLVLLVLLVQWLFRRHLNPQWRCALWLVVVARLLLPVSIGSPVSLMRWLPTVSSVVLPADTPMGAVEVAGPPLANSTRRSQPNLRSMGETPMPRGTGVSPVDLPNTEPTSVAKPIVLPWASILFWTWLVGMGALGANVLRVTARLNRRFRKLPVCTDPVVLGLLEDCANRMGLRRIPAVVESPEVASPALHGFLRPRLLLPAGFARDFSPAEMRLVFLHELAHLKRHDLPLNWLITGLQVVHWFNPLLWFGFARWRADREIACDALALEAAGAGQNQNYGRTILHLLERNAPRFAGSGLVGILEDRRQLKRRLEMISAFVPGRRRSLLALALVGVLAAVGLTDAQTVAPAAPPPVIPASAGVIPQQADHPKVGTITVRFIRVPDGDEKQILEMMKVRPGSDLDVPALDQDVRSIYLTKLYDTVQILRAPNAANPNITDLTVELSRVRLSVDFPDEDIRSILRNVADLFELNIVIPQSLEGKASIKRRDATWREIYKAVLDPVGYTYIQEGNIIRIVPKSAAPAAPATPPVRPQSMIDPKEPWRALARKDFASFDLSRFPPDDSVVAPMAAEGDNPDGNTAEWLRIIGTALHLWQPAKVADPVQRVRNFLYVAGAADLGQLPIERDLPNTILTQLVKEFPDRNELAQILCWIAMKPQGGEDTAIDRVAEVIGNDFNLRQDKSEIRNRAYYYAVKLMSRTLAMR